MTARPVLWVYAEGSGGAIEALFARRGFDTLVCAGIQPLQQALGKQVRRPDAVVIDFETPEAARAARILLHNRPRPLLIAAASAEGELGDQQILDAAFTRPVDPGRLFARAVNLLAERRKGPDANHNRLTGLIGVVQGNEWFKLAERELWSAVPPINAGAVLEKALAALGAAPKTIGKADLAAMLESGRLRDALDGFGEPQEITDALHRLAANLRA